MEFRSRRSQAQDIIRLDSEGNWYQGEYPILHERTCQFFYKHISMDEDGHYYLTGEDKPVYIEIEEVPYWVTKIERTIAGFLITLTDESIELLDLGSIWIGKKNALYCLIKQGTQPAKFSRSAYYEIMRELQQADKKYFIVFKGKKYTIQTSPPKGLSTKKKIPPKKKRTAGKRGWRVKEKSKPAVEQKKKQTKKRPARKLKKAAKKKKSIKKKRKKKKQIKKKRKGK